jgi:putative phage-type endonuclease
MGVSPWRTAEDLFLEKTGQGKPQETNFAMQRGLDLEEEARQCFEQVSNHIVFPKVVISAKYPYLMASLDGMTMDETIIVEIKCSGHKDHQIALDGKIPEKYWPQLQQQMIVTNLHKMYYFSYRTFYDFCLVEVFKDDLFCEELISKTKRFWDCVKSGVLADEFKDKKNFITIEDDNWKYFVNQWKLSKERLKICEELEEVDRKTLISLANNKNCEGLGVRVSKHERCGSIDYSKVEELKGIDLEKYRKPKTEYWKITEY